MSANLILWSVDFFLASKFILRSAISLFCLLLHICQDIISSTSLVTDGRLKILMNIYWNFEEVLNFLKNTDFDFEYVQKIQLSEQVFYKCNRGSRSDSIYHRSQHQDTSYFQRFTVDKNFRAFTPLPMYISLDLSTFNLSLLIQNFADRKIHAQI